MTADAANPLAPTFLVIGAQKCGTTWLAEMLRQHPGVFTPARKELHYFDSRENFARGRAWYEEQFAGSGAATARGECTPNYLWTPEACPATLPVFGLPLEIPEFVNPRIPEQVHEAYPDLRLIVILRNPVDRAISALRHHIRMRRLPPRSRILEVGGKLGILSMGFYAHQLAAWEKFFPRERMLVLVYEKDVLRGRERTLERVYRHVGVEPEFKPRRAERPFNRRASDAFMFARFYSPPVARTVFRAMPFLHNVAIPGMGVTPDERRTLQRVYAEEVLRLEGWLGVTLDEWRTDT